LQDDECTALERRELAEHQQNPLSLLVNVRVLPNVMCILIINLTSQEITTEDAVDSL
jgi:hypothetical protein